jgi:hypothetical protein
MLYWPWLSEIAGGNLGALPESLHWLFAVEVTGTLILEYDRTVSAFNRLLEP